jgi:xylulokinase
LKQFDESLLENAIWLSAADYIVYRLTAMYVTDYSLAGRTYAFDIRHCEWDKDWLQKLGLPLDIFPGAQLAGTIFSSVDDCLAPGTPVCVAGHDHVCAAFAAGTTVNQETILDSMGTAETLLGSWNGHSLEQAEYDSGLLFGCHVVADTYYWMGSLSASGGSIEWLRNTFDETPMSYDEIDNHLERINEPTGILYFPYLAGSSSNGNAGASFIGLKQHHNRAHMLKAAIEGTAYEIEYIRNTVESILDLETKRIVLVGGGTRSPVWIQVKADISGCDYYIYPFSEATLLGAAMVAGIGSGLYQSSQKALDSVTQDIPRIITPRDDYHQQYQQLYKKGYLNLMKPLQAYYAQLISEQSS